MRALSELEGVSLGIVNKYQPCTTYKVRRELKQSPSTHWQASAGSLYPLLTRLEKEGLVKTQADGDDGRRRKLLRVTAYGRTSLLQWIAAGTNEALIAAVSDPLRSRIFFLDVLNAAKRTEYLERLIKGIEDYVTQTKNHLEEKSKADDLYDYLGSLGAVKVVEARLDWLKIVRRRLSREYD